jgi:hypothetical protein
MRATGSAVAQASIQRACRNKRVCRVSHGVARGERAARRLLPAGSSTQEAAGGRTHTSTMGERFKAPMPFPPFPTERMPDMEGNEIVG